MTVVISQLGDTFINSSKIVSFGVKETSSLVGNDSYSIYVDCGSTDSKIIGSFCSREKAMEILKEMTCAIQSGKDYSLP